MSIAQLPPSTVKLISSSQIITSVSSVVKELMENSLDAGATSVDVRLMNSGLDRIEVKDNGSGIKRIDTPHMALPHYTSKISNFSDLEHVNTYGFRGEALNAICQVSQVTITTATSADPMSMTYSLDSSGNITESKPSHHAQGTTVTVSNLFKNLPVRRQYVGSGRKLQEQLKQVEILVKSLAIIKLKCRVTLSHNKCQIWQKTPCSSLQSSFSQVVGYSTCNQMEYLSIKTSMQATVDMLIPRKNSDIEELCKSTQSTSLVFINERTVTYKKITKILHQQLASYFGEKFPSRKYAICLISIITPPTELDVNLNPSKTLVLLKDEDKFLNEVKKSLEEYYNPSPRTKSPEVITCDEDSSLNSGNTESEAESCVKRRKIDTDSTSSLKEFDKQTIKIQRESETSCTMEKKLLHRMVPNTLERCTPDSEVAAVSEEDLNMIMDKYPSNGCLINDCTLPEEVVASHVERQTEPLEENKDRVEHVEDNTENISSVINTILGEDKDVEMSCNGSPTSRNGEISIRNPSPDLFSDISFIIPPDQSKMSVPSPPKNINGGDEVDIEAWSMGRLQGEKGNLLQGACVFIHGREAASTDERSEGSTSSSAAVPNRDNKISDTTAAVEDTPKNKEMSYTVTNIPCGEKTPPKSPKCSSPRRKFRKSPRRSELVDGLPLDNSLLSVSSQMGRRELSAFTKFAREVRPQIILQNPGIAFTRVSVLLAEQWRELPPVEKDRYEEIARQTATNRKVWQTADRQRTLDWVQKLPPKLQEKEKGTNGSSGKQIEKKEVICDYTMKCIEVKCLEADSSKNSRLPKTRETNNISLLGQLEPSGCWISMVGAEIGLLSHCRLQEVVVYHRLLETYSLPLKELPVREEINQQMLGEEAWCTFKSLICSDEVNSNVTTAEVISKNGFKIELVEGGDRAYLTHVASTINFYGLRELKEILELSKLSSPIKLSCCRPLRVINHIKGEAMRICRKSPSILERAMVEELLLYWKTSMKYGNRECLHYEPIITPLFDLATYNQKHSST